MADNLVEQLSSRLGLDADTVRAANMPQEELQGVFNGAAGRENLVKRVVLGVGLPGIAALAVAAFSDPGAVKTAAETIFAIAWGAAFLTGAVRHGMNDSAARRIRNQADANLRQAYNEGKLTL